MGLSFVLLAGLAFVLLIATGLTLPLGLVLFARLAFVVIEGNLTQGRWRTVPLMYRLGLGLHVLLASGFTLYGIGQLVGLV
ncbi:hypothetical protein [Rubricoccus marinus]|uniref:Uncharacterized protein n=1 Tax=Rubricoccus marinus TaxID=716817 RepID=A0A259TZI6_9BACT|nr:hypothetical protein [Rubricoccus marinus]OZC02974.1 hypothetical protein BSZ36_08315 [Rubricoccus marinus]